MKEVADVCVVFFGYAFLALFAQNAVFTRGLGVSRLIQLVGDGEVSSLKFGLMLCVTQVLTAPLAYFAWTALAALPYRAAIRPLVYIICIAAVCGAEYLALSFAKLKNYLGLIPLAALNSGVLGTVLVERTQSFTLTQSLGFGLGSGLGYIMAVLLVSEAQVRLRRGAIPRAFRGLPITLIYIGVLALAIYGFTGHSVIL